METEDPSGASARGTAYSLRPSAWPAWLRYALLAVLGALALYGVLWGASRLSQSKVERLALVEPERLRVEGYGGEGRAAASHAVPGAAEGAAAGETASDSAGLDARYLQALGDLRAARTATLGLFPRYDTEALRRAARQFEAIVETAEPGAFLHSEALFFLGKARLALGDKAAATRALRRVIMAEGRLALEAQRILAALYEDAAYDGPPAGS